MIICHPSATAAVVWKQCRAVSFNITWASKHSSKQQGCWQFSSCCSNCRSSNCSRASSWSANCEIADSRQHGGRAGPGAGTGAGAEQYWKERWAAGECTDRRYLWCTVCLGAFVLIGCYNTAFVKAMYGTVSLCGSCSERHVKSRTQMSCVWCGFLCFSSGLPSRFTVHGSISSRFGPILLLLLAMQQTFT